MGSFFPRSDSISFSFDLRPPFTAFPFFDEEAALSELDMPSDFASLGERVVNIWNDVAELEP
jgi:hypothetical protein